MYEWELKYGVKDQYSVICGKCDDELELGEKMTELLIEYKGSILSITAKHVLWE